MSLLDLAPLQEIETQLQLRRARERHAEVAFLASPIGPGRAWPAEVNWGRSFPLPFPSATVPAELAMAKLAADPAMLATLGPYDIALLDTSERSRSPVSPSGLYVIERDGEAVLRTIRSGAHRHYLATDADLDVPAAWEPLVLSAAQFGAAVKARVCWLGRERDRDELSQRGRFLYDPISS